MKKHIKWLIESLFDDNIINDTDNIISDHIINKEIKLFNNIYNLTDYSGFNMADLDKHKLLFNLGIKIRAIYLDLYDILSKYKLFDKILLYFKYNIDTNQIKILYNFNNKFYTECIIYVEDIHNINITLVNKLSAISYYDDTEKRVTLSLLSFIKQLYDNKINVNYLDLSVYNNYIVNDIYFDTNNLLEEVINKLPKIEYYNIKDVTLYNSSICILKGKKQLYDLLDYFRENGFKKFNIHSFLSYIIYEDKKEIDKDLKDYFNIYYKI